jgi:hypothetical protein
LAKILQNLPIYLQIYGFGSVFMKITGAEWVKIGKADGSCTCSGYFGWLCHHY